MSEGPRAGRRARRQPGPGPVAHSVTRCQGKERLRGQEGTLLPAGRDETGFWRKQGVPGADRAGRRPPPSAREASFETGVRADGGGQLLKRPPCAPGTMGPWPEASEGGPGGSGEGGRGLWTWCLLGGGIQRGEGELGSSRGAGVGEAERGGGGVGGRQVSERSLWIPSTQM